MVGKRQWAYNRSGENAVSDPGFRRFGQILAMSVLVLSVGPIHPSPAPLAAQNRADVPGLLRRIRDEVLELRRYPGEDFVRGEFHLGEGDDDTNKTHAVGILIKDEDAGGGRRMTIVVTRLEPSAADPRIRHSRESETLVCRFAADEVEILSSDHPPEGLGRLLRDILKAVVDKKNLLKEVRRPPGPVTSL
jgi:hypothetical protein